MIHHTRPLPRRVLASATFVLSLVAAACGTSTSSDERHDAAAEQRHGDAGEDISTHDGQGADILSDDATDAGAVDATSEAAGKDTDGDGVPNAIDNCLYISNTEQADLDQDGKGDVCDRDLDGDQVKNPVDNCPWQPNLGQEDADQDGIGDACDPHADADSDGDGVFDTRDNCPFTANAGQEDQDKNGIGDLCDATCGAWPATEGYAKDIFVDGGIGLTALEPPAIAFLGLSVDAYFDTVPSASDPDYKTKLHDNVLEQDALLVGHAGDENGVLLYPDGAPRYRAVFVNGGGSSNHYQSLGELGSERFRTFFDNGGSYTGSCAGAILAASFYFALWPQWVDHTYITDVHRIVFDDINHPLVQLYPSLQDGAVEDVQHNGGVTFRTPPAGTEIIGRVDLDGYTPRHPAHQDWYDAWDGEATTIAYKNSVHGGRLVLNSSHPEKPDSGEILEYMAAVFRYALAGTIPLPWLKGTLHSGTSVSMTAAADAIGDKQYHRWMLELPAAVTKLTITVSGATHNLELYVNHGCPAHRLQSLHKSEQPGTNDETIVIDNPPAGSWHISVYGNHDHANGSPYQLTASWQ